MKCVLVTLHYFEGIEIVTLLLYILYIYIYTHMLLRSYLLATHSSDVNVLKKEE